MTRLIYKASQAFKLYWIDVLLNQNLRPAIKNVPVSEKDTILRFNTTVYKYTPEQIKGKYIFVCSKMRGKMFGRRVNNKSIYFEVWPKKII